jgi:hypothetical protein
MDSGKENDYQYMTNLCFMPDGSPVPEVMTKEEVIKFLRLDADGVATPIMTLKYYREKNLLRGTQIGKNLRYTKQEVLYFLMRQTEQTNKRSA